MMNFIVPLGGQGAACALACEHIDTAMIMYGATGLEAEILYSPMDEGNADVIEARTLREWNQEIRRNSDRETYLAGPETFEASMAEILREKYPKTRTNPNNLTIKNIADTDSEETTLLNALFTDDQSGKILSGGYYKDMSLGFTGASHVMGLAFQNGNHPYNRIVDAVVKAKNDDIIRVLMIYSLNGGEGRSTGATLPGMLRKQIVDTMVKSNGWTEQVAENTCQKKLSIAQLLIGDIEGYPPPPNGKIEADVSLLIRDALKNFPEDVEHDCDYIIYSDLSGGDRFIQAEKYVEFGNQTKVAHAVQLSHYAVIHSYFHDNTNVPEMRKNAGKGTKDKAPLCIPVYTDPVGKNGDNRIDWDTLKLEGTEIHKAIINRIRFEFALRYCLEKDLEDINLVSDVPLFRHVYSSLYHLLLGIPPHRDLTSDDKDELKKFAYKPVKSLTEREHAFIDWLGEISLTGKDHSKDLSKTKSVTYLWNESSVLHWFNPENIESPDTDDSDLINSFSVWSRKDGNSDNPALAKVTPYSAFHNVQTTYDHIGEKQMMHILQEIYDSLKI